MQLEVEQIQSLLLTVSHIIIKHSIPCQSATCLIGSKTSSFILLSACLSVCLYLCLFFSKLNCTRHIFRHCSYYFVELNLTFRAIKYTWQTSLSFTATTITTTRPWRYIFKKDKQQFEFAYFKLLTWRADSQNFVAVFFALQFFFYQQVDNH